MWAAASLTDCRDSCAGVYDERVFRGLDYVIAQAARHGIKVIVALNNYWENSDSVGNVSTALDGVNPRMSLLATVTTVVYCQTTCCAAL